MNDEIKVMQHALAIKIVNFGDIARYRSYYNWCNWSIRVH